MKKIAIRCFIAFMNFIYFFLKAFHIRDKVTVISRQSDDLSLDLMLLKSAFEENRVNAVFLTKKLDVGFIGILRYFLHMFRQMYHIATSKVVIVDSYCILVSVLKHKNEIKIIQMWHALSAIKQFGYQTLGKKDGWSHMIAKEMKMHKNYDYILCSSDITADHFCQAFGVQRDKIVKIGLPRIDYILNVEKKQADILKKYPQLNKKKTILYVPTFRKHRKIELFPLINAIDFAEYNLLIKLHPLDAGSKIDFDNGCIIYDTQFNSYDLLSVADIVISDYSSYVIESTLVNKPIYLYTYDYDEYKQFTGLNFEYSDEAIGKYCFKDAKQMCESFNEKYDFNAINIFRQRYIDIDINNCSDQIVKFVMEKMKS